MSSMVVLRPENKRKLREGCDVLIATLGRLTDFMSRGLLLSLSRVKLLLSTRSSLLSIYIPSLYRL